MNQRLLHLLEGNLSNIDQLPGTVQKLEKNNMKIHVIIRPIMIPATEAQSEDKLSKKKGFHVDSANASVCSILD